MRSTPSPGFMINVRLPEQLEPYPVDEPITDDALITRRSMTDVRLSEGRAHLVDLEECRWHGGTLSGSTLTKLTASDQAFSATDLALVKAPEASLTRVRLDQCRLSGLDLAGATAQQMEINDAVADYLSMRMARLKQVRFDRCRLTHADFGGARLEQVVFRGCDLTDADFHRVEVRHTWFIDCTWQRTGGIASLRGATIVHTDPMDAIALVVPLGDALGITVTSELGER